MGARRAAVVVRADGAGALEGVVALAARIAPVTLAMTAEAATGAARTRPELAARVGEAIRAGRIGVVLATAHGAAGTLLDADELADELRLDEETLQALFGAHPPRRGFDGAADAEALAAAGVDFVLGAADGEPARVGERLLALPALRVDAARDDLRVAEAWLRARRDGGAEVVTADAWAEALTPPWLPERARAVAGPPATLAALAALTGWCVDAFGLRRVPGVPAQALVDEGWRLERFPTRARLPLLRRRGLVADRRAFVAAYELCDVLAVEARVPGLSAHATAPLGDGVLARVAALAAAHGAGEPMARAEAAYDELRAFRFLGAQRWRALLSSLRDAFALLASRPRVDWSVTPAPDEEPAPSPWLALPSATLN